MTALRTEHQSEPPKLRRVLSLGDVTASGVGIIIGAGIYVLVGAATAKAGASVWLAFLLAAILCGLTGLSYAELASMFPSAGAEYEYTRQAFPSWVAFLVGWTMIAGLIVAAATVTLGFAGYLGYFIHVPAKVGALALLLLITGIALAGIRHSARISVALSVAQVGGLLLVIFAGIPHVGTQNLLDLSNMGGIVGAAALIFFAFIGFDEVITLAEETRDPARTVPRALLLALGISAVLYMAVSITAVSVLGAAAIANSDRPLADVLAHILGSRGAAIVAVAALLSTFNTSLLCLTAASRLIYGMASNKAIPGGLSAVHPATGTPYRAVLLAAGLALGFVLAGHLTVIAGVTDLAVYIVFLAVHATVIRLRVTRPAEPRRFRVPWSIGAVPLPAALGIISVAFMLTRLDAPSLVIGGMMLGAGLAAAMLSRKLQHA